MTSRGDRAWLAAGALLLVLGLGVLWVFALPALVVGLVVLRRYGPRTATLAVLATELAVLPLLAFW